MVLYGSMVELVPWREANVHVLTHTFIMVWVLLKGFEHINTEGTGIFRLEDHTKRLINSAKILRYENSLLSERD